MPSVVLWCCRSLARVDHRRGSARTNSSSSPISNARHSEMLREQRRVLRPQACVLTSNPTPALRTPFPNNAIPGNRIDIAALEIMKRLPLPNQPGFTNNFATAGVAEFNRTNADIKINYDGGKLTLFGRYSRSPTLIIDPPIFGEVSGPALNGGQLGTAPGLINVFGVGATYSFSPNVVLDANVGYTRQRLGAEGFDIVSNFGLDVLHIPGTNGPDFLQGGGPGFQINGGWTNIGT